MKNLNKLGLQELTNQELLNVEGGSIFSKAWNWLCDSVSNAWEAGKNYY